MYYIKLLTMKAIELFCSFAALAALTSGVTIQCNYSIENGAGIYNNYYVCAATVISEENPTTVTEINGTHLTGFNNAFNNDHVKGFWMQNENLSSTPKGIENFFPNLEEFAWYSGISTIDSSTFKPFPELLRIGFGSNKIVSLDGNLFQYTRKLQEINFSRNKLEHVGHDLLKGLTATVLFGSNPCISARAYSIEEIQELNLLLPIRCPPLATHT